MGIIDIDSITKDYGNSKGIFDISVSIEKGEVFGLLGPAESGKTTLIRHLLGFIRPENGSCTIDGYDCFTESSLIKQNLGYLPEEISFPEDMTGTEVIDLIAGLKGIREHAYINELIEFFEFNPEVHIKKMSKVMKHKLGIICCFMGNPDIIILDEPTVSLDTLTRKKLKEFLLKEKKLGKTIFISSHVLDEVENTCDRVAVIKSGKIEDIDVIENLRKIKTIVYMISFATKEDMALFSNEVYNMELIGDYTIKVKGITDINEFLKTLSSYNVARLDIERLSLEDLFAKYYDNN